MRHYDVVVYVAKNKNNGKIYVGCSSYGLAMRKSQHKQKAKKGVKSPFYDAIRKEGFESFEWKVVKVFETKKAANEFESFVIKKILKDKLYNTHSGDERHKHKLSKETKKKLSKRMMGKNNPMYGNKLTQEEKDYLLACSKEVCCKKVIRISDGQEYESVSECARQNNKSIATISMHVNNKLKTSKFKFK